LHELAEPDLLVSELFRVLKPGGKVVAIVPAKYDYRYWRNVVLHPWRAGRHEHPDLLASPWTGNDGTTRDFSRRRLRRLFGSFEGHRIHQRHIRRHDLPWISRCIPRSWLERSFGQLLILKAFKPVVAIARRVAA
jgi:SAM-dependent methyltransferase